MFKITSSIEYSVNSVDRRLLWLLVIFVGGNAALWGLQELYYWDDTQKMNQLKEVLDDEMQEITQLETQITVEKNKLESVETQLDTYESLGNIDEYNKLVYEFNDFLGQYTSVVNEYDAKISAYNTKVDEYNLLVEKTGSRFYLIPLPLPSNVHKI